MTSSRPTFGSASSRLLALATVAAALAAAPKAQAQNYTWQGGNYDSWFLANWFGTAFGQFPPPSPIVNLYFGPFADSNGIVDNNFIDDLDILSLNFSNQNWHLTGKSFRFQLPGAIKVASTSSVTQMDNAVSFMNGLNLDVAGNSRLQIEGVLSGTGGLVKSGTGFATLTNTNTYTGGTTVNGGQLTVKQMNGGYAVASGAYLGIISASAQTYSGVISGAGSFQKSLAGTFTLSGINTYTGGTKVFQGRLIDQHPHGDYTMEAAGTVEFPVSSDLGYSGSVSGVGAFVKTGAGTMNLYGSMVNSGGTVVDAGTLVTWSNTAMSTSTALAVNGSGVVDLIGRTVNVGTLAGDGSVHLNTGTLNVGGSANAAFSGVISGPGSFVKSGSGEEYLVGVNTYNGGTTVSGGTLLDQHPHGNYVDNALLWIAPHNDINFSGVISGTGKVWVGGNTSTSFTFSGVNTYSGDTIAYGGTQLTDLHLHGNYDVDGLSSVTFPTPTDLTYSGVISGAGRFNKTGAGTLTRTAAAQNTGVTIVQEGRLVDLVPHGSYRDNAELEFRNAGDVTLTGTISGSGSLTKSAFGSLLLNGQSTYSGTTTITAGLLGNSVNNALPPGTALAVNTGAVYRLFGFSQTIGSLSGPGDVLLTGGALTVGDSTSTTYSGVIAQSSGSLKKQGAGTLTLSGINLYTGGTTVTNGRLIDANPHDNYVTNAALEFSTTGTKTYAGVVSGTGSLTKSGSGTLTLSASSTYAGSTSVSAGTLRNGKGNSLPVGTALTVDASGIYSLNFSDQTIGSLSGDGSVALTNRFLTVNGTANTTFSGVASGTGKLLKSGSGTLTLAGIDTYTGGTTVNGGRLIELNPHGAYVTNAALEFAKAGDYAYATPIAGSGSFTKSGAGTLTLSGLSTFSGGTIVNEGRLIDQSPHGGYVTNTILEFAKAGDYAQLTPIAGTGSFVKSGAGTVTLSGASTYGGSTTVNVGILRNSVDNALPSSTGLTVNSGATYDLAGNAQTIAALEGVGSVTLGAGALTVSPATGALPTFAGVISGTGSLTKAGAGVLTLTGLNTYSGGTAVNAGRLVVENPNGNYLTNATLEFTHALDSTYGGALTGTGTFVKSGAGTLALTGSVAPGVTTQISAGTLKATASVLQGNVVGALGTTFQIDQSKAGTYGATYSGTGAFLKTGSRSLTLANAPSNTGGVRVSGGSLSVDTGGMFDGGLTVDPSRTFLNTSDDTLTVGGRSFNQGEITTLDGSTTVFTGLVSGSGGFSGLGTVDFQGGYSPGNSPASVTFQGDLMFSSNLTMELGGTTLGTGYDHLTVNGLATLGGSLTVAYYGGFSASLGQTFDLFDFGSSTGTFSAINLPTLDGKLRWNTSHLYTDGSIQAVPEPASLAALTLGTLALLRRRRK